MPANPLGWIDEDSGSNILWFVLPAFAVGVSFGLLKTGFYDSAGVLGTSTASLFGSVGIALSFGLMIVLRKFQSSANTRTIAVLISWVAIFTGAAVSVLNISYQNEVLVILLISFGVSAFDFCLMTASVDSEVSKGRMPLGNLFFNRAANYIGVAIGTLFVYLLDFHLGSTLELSDAHMFLAFTIIFLIAVASISSISASMLIRIKTLHKSISDRGESAAKGTPFLDAIKELSNEGGLTQRESQVFEYLARGRNVEFISDELVLSKQTTKTHVSKIYKKLDVHSHQELLTLIEEKRKSGKDTFLE